MTYIVEEETPIAAMYRQYDGYIDGHGKELAGFLAGKHLVNGFGPEDEGVAFNGLGDLGVRLFVALKALSARPPIGRLPDDSYGETGPAPAPQDSIGGYYLCNPALGQEEEYNYYVGVNPKDPAKIQVTVRAYEKEIFRGSPEELLAFKEEEED